jgi:hypothetical protein
MDENLWLREAAGSLLTRFEHIDPRHLPALVQAWRHGDTVNNQGRGNDGMPAVIAATGTFEALNLLWEDYERDPHHGDHRALARFPEQLRPLLLARMARCRDSVGDDVNYRGPCLGNYELLEHWSPPFPAWGIDALMDIALNGRSVQLREETERRLASLHHPGALPLVQRRLAGLIAEADRASPAERNAYGLLMTLADYGAAARSSGPAIAFFLDRRFNESLREAAIKAAGRVGDPVAVPGLLAQAPELTDNWQLAMAVTESLGRLRAPEARPLLERLARDHWHRAVRENATHALAALANPARSASTSWPDIDASENPGAGSCDAEDGREITLLQNPVGALRWPARGIMEVEAQPIDEALAATLRRRVPVQRVQGEVRFTLPLRGGTLIGIDGGEFGGGLVHLPNVGPPVVLGPANVTFAWRMGGKLFVASGLRHFTLNTGSLQIVDLRTMRIERSIQLPASPYRLRALAGHVAVVDTGHGDLAIREDGQLVDVERLQGCMGD